MVNTWDMKDLLYRGYLDTIRQLRVLGRAVTPDGMAIGIAAYEHRMDADMMFAMYKLWPELRSHLVHTQALDARIHEMCTVIAALYTVGLPALAVQKIARYSYPLIDANTDFCC